MKHSLGIGLVAAAMLCATWAQAGAVRPGFDSNTMQPNDDWTTGWLELPFTMDFFGNVHDGLYVNTNGMVTLDVGLYARTIRSLADVAHEYIAPFFGDVDTRYNSSLVTYGVSEVGGRAAFGVNWVGVNCYHSFLHANTLNSFQLVLIDRSETGEGNFDIEFNYDQIIWETGQDSGGGSDCLGGTSAYVGYTAGTGEDGTYYELLGSGIPGSFLDDGPEETSLVQNSLNSDVLGRYVFYARSAEILRTCDDWDGDWVCDDSDACPDTAEGELIDGDGCAISDYCPCDGGWKTHGKYVKCVDRATDYWFDIGLVTDQEGTVIHSEAANSDCGDRRK
jgi:hypothetical protein